MNVSELAALHAKVATEMVKSVETPWERIVVNFEIIDTPTARAMNEFTFIVQKDAADKHSVANFVMSDAAKAALLELRDANISEAGDKWNTCIVIVDPPGRFRFDVSYDEPKVLNGILDDDYKFYRKYLPHYLEEKGLSQ